MAAASLEELRFFFDNRDDIAQRVQATRASTSQVMAAIEAHGEGVLLLGASTGVHEVCAILDEEDQSVDVDVDDL